MFMVEIGRLFVCTISKKDSLLKPEAALLSFIQTKCKSLMDMEACVAGGMCVPGGGRAWQGGGVCGGGHAWQGLACMAGCMHGKGHVWQGACVHGKGACMAGGRVCHSRYYGIRSMSGRYASYWNAFFL